MIEWWWLIAAYAGGLFTHFIVWWVYTFVNPYLGR